ncbi:hypothetical protein XENTR_v10022481 [Xenopus tropicalis]|nr:hypothetical protein XENTR_v10022481 [Xenopus tropicalis]
MDRIQGIAMMETIQHNNSKIVAITLDGVTLLMNDDGGGWREMVSPQLRYRQDPCLRVTMGIKPRDISLRRRIAASHHTNWLFTLFLGRFGRLVILLFL